MRKTGKIRRGSLINCILTLMAAVIMVLCIDCLGFDVQAAGTGRITATSAKIRKEASTSSEMVGSAQNGVSVTINSEVQGADGYVWYQVTVDNMTGYIRSDLIEKTDSTGGTVTVNPTVEVTQVQPTGATVTGGQLIRVRADASTSSASSIITTLNSGTAITVKGQANGTDGNVWYLVSFMNGNVETEGFIRSEYVSLSGELTPIDTTTPPQNDPTEPDTPTSTPETPEVQKLYDTALSEDGTWVLLDYTKDEKWPLVDLLEDYQTKKAELTDAEKSVKTQKIVIIILVVFLIAAILAATMLYFKVRDVMDDAYFAAVEKETLRERNAMKNKDNRAPARKVMQTVGTEGTKMASEGRGAGNRPQNKPQNRPDSTTVNGKPRPAQSSGQTRPVSQPTGQVKPSQPGSQSKTMMPSANQTKPVTQQAVPKQAKPVQNKGFANDEDEFEFEFLNWDGEDK